MANAAAATTTTCSTTITTAGGGGSAKKRRKQTLEEHQALVPGLPDHLAQLCLSLVPPSLLYSVSHSWRRLIYSPFFPPFLSLYTLFHSSSSSGAAVGGGGTTRTFLGRSETHQFQSNPIEFLSFDPISSKWSRLPPPPLDPHHGPLLLRHPSFLSRNLPIQSVSVSNNHLVLLAATNPNLLPALCHPQIFDPESNQWFIGPPFSSPRRWCAAGSTDGTLFMVSGVGSHYNPEVARSAERCNLRNREWVWEKVASLRDGRFCRDAVEAVGWRRKLCMVNLKGNAPKEGAIYDVENDRWEEMPEGMVLGWNGPATAMEEEVIYVVDEDKGLLKKYNPERDSWESVIQSTQLRGAAQITAASGKICAVNSSGFGIVIVDLLFPPPRIWTLETPPLLHTLSVHILPRTSWPEVEQAC